MGTQAELSGWRSEPYKSLAGDELPFQVLVLRAAAVTSFALGIAVPIFVAGAAIARWAEARGSIFSPMLTGDSEMTQAWYWPLLRSSLDSLHVGMAIGLLLGLVGLALAALTVRAYRKTNRSGSAPTVWIAVAFGLVVFAVVVADRAFFQFVTRF